MSAPVSNNEKDNLGMYYGEGSGEDKNGLWEIASLPRVGGSLSS